MTEQPASAAPSESDAPTDGHLDTFPPADSSSGTVDTGVADTPAAAPVEPPPVKDPLRGSKASGVYAAVIGLGIVLILLIIFIAQNGQKAEVHFLGLNGRASVSVLLLIAAAAGLFIAGLAGLLRILQLRRRVKHVRKELKKRAKA